MKSKIFTVVRILFGLILIAFGANKFLGFMPMPELSGGAGDFMEALTKTGYIFPVIGAVELGVGLLLVLNIFTPLALIVLVPISVNIVLFHLFLDMGGIVPAAVIAGLNVFFIVMNLSAYLSMLRSGHGTAD
jgi:putative oxidoreductase